MNMISDKCARIIRLSMDVEGCESFVKCLDERTFVLVEALFESTLKVCYLCFLE